MPLTLGECTLDFNWQADAWSAVVEESNEYALAACARDGIEYIQADAPYLTGSLQSSVHAAVPGHAADEEPLYNRRIEGVYRDRRVPSIAELVKLIRDDAIWIGTWIPYGYYIDQGFYHVLAARQVAGKNFVIPNAERGLQNYEDHFRAYYPNALQRAGGRTL